MTPIWIKEQPRAPLSKPAKSPLMRAGLAVEAGPKPFIVRRRFWLSRLSPAY
jgi:hypothetical protein